MNGILAYAMISFITIFLKIMYDECIPKKKVSNKQLDSEKNLGLLKELKSH